MPVTHGPPTITINHDHQFLVCDPNATMVPSGAEVRYWIEAKDNDSVGGPNIGRSRELHLKVISPRERHEETLGRQQELAEKIVKNLGGRLTLKDDGEPAPREEVARVLKESVVELENRGVPMFVQLEKSAVTWSR